MLQEATAQFQHYSWHYRQLTDGELIGIDCRIDTAYDFRMFGITKIKCTKFSPRDKKKRTGRDANESPAASVTLRNFYFTIIYDNKMYYLYDKINKAVDTSRRFSSVSFITSSCNAPKFLRLPSTLRVFVVGRKNCRISDMLQLSDFEHVNTSFFS